ncbi:MAG TPA: ethanolamine ammonia-lyase subunit EutC [Bryobacteraceae bacterium]|nr:ethanolamine ammonia-lyase subunit EutC [Bryobacteraceae bacterium]
MSLPELRDFTTARVGLPRAGISLPTKETLALQLAHARARGAVHAALDVRQLVLDLKPLGQELIEVHSQVPGRPAYLRRPDLGRRLNEKSRALLGGRRGKQDAVFVIADGLSAAAAQLHAAPTIDATLQLIDGADWNLAPFVIAEQGRVAIGDEIGECLGAALSVVFIGERPGLSSSDSLGIYLSWNPHAGLADADRNCISNIRAAGLSYAVAAHKLAFLMTEARRRKLSGVALKEDANLLGK